MALASFEGGEARRRAGSAPELGLGGKEGLAEQLGGGENAAATFGDPPLSRPLSITGI